jgi:serine/threonine-protein kinase
MVPSPGPSKIGKYDVEERVGEGAMGVVYRAIDPVLKRRVAIKVMSDAFAQNDDLRERFLREAQAAGSLQHPNVITIYDFGDVDGHPYIAMEFVEGQDVAELIAHQVPLSVVDKLDLAIGVLQGLAYAHRRGIVHRDIKPANIRIDDEGKARIMDFGVAHLASSNMTKSGVMLGTPSYMAPEQIVGGKVGPQTDIFSVGAVLYELLTGARPFEGGTLQAVMYRVLSENPASLSTAAPGLPARLNDVVMRALAKDAENRYSSALDMANDLLAVRAAIDASAASPGTLSLRATIESAIEVRKSREIQHTRNRRVVLSSGGVALAAVLMLTTWALARRGAGSGIPSVPQNHAPPSSAPAGTNSPAAVTTAPTSPAPNTTTEQLRPIRSVSSPSSTAGNRTPETPSDRARNAPQSAPKPESNAAIVQSAARPQERVAPTQTPAANTGPPVTAPANQPTQPAATTTAGSSQPVVSPPPAPAPTSAPVAEVRPSGGAAAPSPTSQGTSATATANATPEIGAVIDAYARAIESRSIDELRRAYPAITPDQARAFSDFFASTRTLRATLAVKSLHVDGASATASVAGIYEFTTTNGRSQQQSVSFQTELRRDGSAWKLTAVR